MDWTSWPRSWCNRVASKLAMVSCSVTLVASTAHADPSAPPTTPTEDVSFGSVEVGPDEGRAVPPRPRRQLDERFALGVHHRLAEKPGHEFVENRRQETIYRDPERRFRATLHPDGRLSFRNRGMNFRNQRMMGLYDVILKAQGAELHQNAKRSVLRETFADRMAMRVNWTLDNLEHAERQLWLELNEIWHDERLPLAERKRILLQRWAECDVDVDVTAVGGVASPVDQQRRTTGRRAQRTIEHFVRTHVADPGSVATVTTEHRVQMTPEGATPELVRVSTEEPFNFHGALSDSAGGPPIDAAHDLAVSLAPDLFEACERDPSACISVGDLLVGRRANAFDAERGADYYGRACDAGDPWACYELAVLHYLGLGVSRDDRRSARLHGVACDAGVAEGCAYLAHLHRRGLGVPRSDADSAEYRRRACDRGLDEYCR